MKKFDPRLQFLFFAGLTILLALVFFYKLLLPETVLHSSDNNLAHNAMMHRCLPGSILAAWIENPLAGTAGSTPLNLTNLISALLPPVLFSNVIHPFYLIGGTLFMLAFLRNLGLSWQASCLGGLIGFWLSSNLTLIYAGHTSKFAILFLSAAFLWLVSWLPLVSRNKHRLSGIFLAGGIMGLTVTEQADVGLFFCLLLGPYALFTFFSKCNLRGRQFLTALFLFLLPAFLLVVRPALENYRQNVKNVAALSEDDPAAAWHFVTQWSWPPEESIDFIAPGYTGWRSLDPAGPYWGRMGQSAEWLATGQGFQNFKLENMYLGVIPLVCVFVAVIYGVSTLRRLTKKTNGQSVLSEKQLEIWFWCGAALVALLLSFGKYFPLYQLFYKLPFLGSIRNPNKFLQIFQLAIAVLAAYGLDLAASSVEKPVSSEA